MGQYDAQGRLKQMTNWSAFSTSAGARVTTWNYNAYRGWLDAKDYPDASTGNPGTTGTDYTYTPGGRLKTRVWARGITTTYKYGFDDATGNNQYGELTLVDYSDSTPDVTYAYDRRGRQKTITHNSITATLAYNDANQQLSETFSGGILDGLAVTNAYDVYLRRTAVGLNTQPATLVNYGYGAANRLRAVTNGSSHATYAYLANSPLVSQIAFTNSGTGRMTTTKAHDYVNRLSSISSSSSSSFSSSHAYTYNDANQRTRATLADGSWWLYEYDALGQVKRGARYWSDGVPVAGQQFDYGHDDIGNRTETKAGGDAVGSSLRLASYTSDKLNRYSSRDVPGYADVMGIALATNTVTVNSQSTYRKGEYFRKELSVANGSVPVWQNVSVAATGETTVNRNAFVPKTAEVFGYDSDGNLTGDGRWTFTWDAENRLVKVESLSGGPAASKRKVEWTYDYRGRRIRQTTSDGSSGSYVVTEDLKFLSDGWRHLAELNYSDNALKRSYAWGLDLSGSLDGAGGVGGLLMLNSAANGTHFHAYDGNGNVTALVKASDGTASALYEYEPFGQALRATGPMAAENRFQFSTKRCDPTTDFVLYEYRAYSLSLGRWLNRDPIEEDDGPNLYAFVHNRPVSAVDAFGLSLWLCTSRAFGIPGVNHAYMWDDRDDQQYNPSDPNHKYRDCSMQWSSGKGGTHDDSLKGPPSGLEEGQGWDLWYGDDGVVCQRIPNSTGKEQAALDCCRDPKKMNKGIWFPGLNDCHNPLDKCLKEGGIPQEDIPRHPRFGDPLKKKKCSTQCDRP